MIRSIATTLAALLSATTALASDYMYDGAQVKVNVSRDKVTITYVSPKDGSQRAGTRPGTVLFRGRMSTADNGSPYVDGDARIFKRGCDPTPYHVYGPMRMPYSFTLRGAAPVLAEDGCAIVDNVHEGPNAVLRFVTMATGIIAPAPQPKPVLVPRNVPGAMCVTGVDPSSFLNVRSGPAKTYGNVAKLKPDVCDIAGLRQCINGWCAIVQTSSGVTGWVLQDYISRPR
ncbi:SH3 domain-containing protein [Ahrensia sp. R2A130]|uniref:SH3 domain-containing protein n=1 Tax=Ahrensia sp. R2A130 TaxID=744979 RepID=UPI0001E09CCB|nr:SH3 domain-containing protein [Ahrensia sp. R2A130]EFL88227.1 hypothetical protein R2A130_2046 [Ahrensia sp. R2A130]